MQHPIYSRLKHPEYFMFQKKLKDKCSDALTFTKKVVFEYVLGNFVYDSI